MKLHLFISSLAILLSALSAVECIAASSDPSVHVIAEKVQKNKQKIVEAETEKRRLLASLYSVQKRMLKISKEKSHLTDELIHVEDNVKSIARIIASLEAEIAKQKRSLRGRLRVLYKISGEGYASILFSQRSPQQVDETLRFLKIIAESDYKLIRSYQDNLTLYKQHKDKLKVEVQHLVGIEKKIKSQEKMIATEHQSKMKMVSELDRRRTQSLSDIRILRKKTEQNAEIDELLKPSIFEQKGQLAPPVVGFVLRDFGLTTDEKYKTRLSHKGFEYSAMPEAPVKAVFEGKVVFGEHLPGYGQTVVVDHGDHYYTVYARLSHVIVTRGEAVKKGQAIASVGTLEASRGQGLYFEIRHFSEPENPRLWLSKENSEADQHLKISTLEKPSTEPHRE